MSFTKPRIGIVSWDFDQPKGGMGYSLQWMRDVLLRAGLGVAVGTVSSAKQQSVIPALFRRGGHLLFSAMLPFTLPSWIAKQAPEALLAPVGPGGVFLLRKPRVPVIGIVYHTYAQQARLVPGQWWKKIFSPLEKWTLNMTAAVCCFCEDTRRVLMETYGIPAEQIELLPHAVDAEPQPDVSKEKGLCICVARCEARKGIDVLLRAWPRVLRQRPDARLVIVGDGILAPAIDRRIGTIGSSARRISRVQRPELMKMLAASEVAVCPAYLEGFGLAAAEAMRTGTAVVASEADGLRSLIRSGETGMLVPTGDPEACAMAILRVVEDDGFRSRMVASALDAARQFDHASADAAFVRAVEDRLA